MKLLSYMKIGPRLVIAFLLVALLAAAVGVIGIATLTSSQATSEEVFRDYGMSQGLIGQIAINFQTVQATTRDMILETDKEKLEAYRKLIDECAAKNNELMAEFKKTIHTVETMAQYEAFEKNLDDYRTVRDKIIALVFESKPQEALALMRGDAEGPTEAAHQSIQGLFETKATNGQKKSDDMAASARSTTLMLIIISVVIALISFGLGLLVSGSISRPLRLIVGAADKLAAGDTDITVIAQGRDEVASLAKSFQSVIQSVNNLVVDANMLSEAAVDGRLNTRADAARHQGNYRKIVDGVNRTLDAAIEPVNEAASVLNEMSRGNLSVNVLGNYKGDHAAIKNALNDTINTIKGYIGEISQVLAEISSGNLNSGIKDDYRGEFSEIKDSINSIVDALNAVLGDINSAAEQVAAGTEQVSAGSQSLSSGATEQASAIEELTAALSSIAGQTKQNAVNANRANELAISSMEVAVTGNSQMKEMQLAMAGINDASNSISKIIKVIDEIAFQTNLLALNAAVEAARAGQHGKGFAVVAEEVRSLAQRSAAAAKETTSMIEESVKKVREGTKMADETARALNQIVDGVEKVTGLVGEIAKASNEQATAVAQVNKGIEQVSQVVQTNSATAEESAAASEELSGQASLLKDMVGRFTLRGKGGFTPRIQQAETRYAGSLHEGKGGSAKPRIAMNDKEFGKY